MCGAHFRQVGSQWCCLHLCIAWELPRAWKIHVLYKFNFRIEMWFSRHQISGTHCIHHQLSKLALSLPYSPQKYNACYLSQSYPIFPKFSRNKLLIDFFSSGIALSVQCFSTDGISVKFQTSLSQFSVLDLFHFCSFQIHAYFASIRVWRHPT